MKLKARLVRLAKSLPQPEPGMGRAPEWFADKVIAFCRHLYGQAGLDPRATRLPPLDKTSRPALRCLLNNGLLHFHQAKGRRPTSEEFRAWWPRGGCP
jgi:hypothetical protein